MAFPAIVIFFFNDNPKLSIMSHHTSTLLLFYIWFMWVWQVLQARNMFRPNKMLGSFKLDVATAWAQPGNWKPTAIIRFINSAYLFIGYVYIYTFPFEFRMLRTPIFHFTSLFLEVLRWFRIRPELLRLVSIVADILHRFVWKCFEMSAGHRSLSFVGCFVAFC